MTIHVIAKNHQVINLPINVDYTIEETDDLIIIHVKD